VPGCLTLGAGGGKANKKVPGGKAGHNKFEGGFELGPPLTGRAERHRYAGTLT